MRVHHSTEPQAKCAICPFSTGYECYVAQFKKSVKEHKKFCDGKKGWEDLEREDKGYYLHGAYV